MILYYRLMTKWSGLGDSTELYRVGLSHKRARPALISPAGEEGDRATPVSRANLKHRKVGGLPTFRKVYMISGDRDGVAKGNMCFWPEMGH
jgi:hypothetical protein